MVDLIVHNFGLLEAVLFLEGVLLATAAVFYKAARIAARNSREDLLVRFYYVFWQAFRAPVTPVRVYDSRLAEERARAMGVIGVGEASAETLARMDAPDLADLTADDLRGRPVETPLPPTPTASARGKAEPATPVADATLDVHIVGRCDADAVAGCQGRTLVLHVRNDVEDGQANGVATTLVAEALGLPVYRVVLLRGQYRADKAFKLISVDPVTLERSLNALPAV